MKILALNLIALDAVGVKAWVGGGGVGFCECKQFKQI